VHAQEFGSKLMTSICFMGDNTLIGQHVPSFVWLSKWRALLMERDIGCHRNSDMFPFSLQSDFLLPKKSTRWWPWQSSLRLPCAYKEPSKTSYFVVVIHGVLMHMVLKCWLSMWSVRCCTAARRWTIKLNLHKHAAWSWSV
jgi:hypothetical protein